MTHPASLAAPRLLTYYLLLLAAALFLAQWMWPQKPSTDVHVEPNGDIWVWVPESTWCNADLWDHVYHKERLKVLNACVSITGTIVDATHGKRKQGCRVEADGDLHCWLKLDAGQEQYLNAMNMKNEGGNLVFEPMCQHRVTQADAQATCKDWKQPFVLPLIGTRVQLHGAHVLDTQHGHMECHPCEIEITK